tara:strand:- start:4267 stop:4653 length:387 start_codon:yes stop_codon:yes gene_type:complete
LNLLAVVYIGLYKLIFRRKNMAHKTIKYGRMELTPVKDSNEWGLFICKTHSGDFFVERVDEDHTGYHKGTYWNLYRWDCLAFGDIDDLKTTCDLPNNYRDKWMESFDRLKDTLPSISDYLINGYSYAD